MNTTAPNPSIRPSEVLAAWGRVLNGRLPMLSIEITRECPLTCPGCYAYGDTHLGGGVTLSELSDKRGDQLVEGVLGLVRKHKPLHVSLVGGEPMVRHRELSRILPALSKMEIFTLLVTSGVIRVPREWMSLPRVRVAISVDGLPEHHDIRRKPATYERILKNIEGCEVNIHWVITRPMLQRAGYLEEYVKFWSEAETNRIWVSVYTPQIGEQSPETLTLRTAKLWPWNCRVWLSDIRSFSFMMAWPSAPCIRRRARMTAFLRRCQPTIRPILRRASSRACFGGTPDCSQCGCAASSGLHWIRGVKVAGPGEG
jgi:sulfatase maturation enzyme AslB (radical SAM superfamily)